MKLRRRLKKIKLVQVMASLKWTVACLLLLFVLTLWGTISQVQEGLYIAQERYFHSLFFLAAGFIPFPGAQLVMWVMFVNLTCAAIVHYVYSWKRVGILIIHGGLMLFLVSGYITLRCAQDSHLTLQEGSARNVSTAFHAWEVAVWEPTEDVQTGVIEHDITAIDIARVKKGRPVYLDRPGLTLTLKEYYRNAAAYEDDQVEARLNVSGIDKLEPLGLEKVPEQNTPGAVFTVSAADTQPFDLLLFGAENRPTPIDIAGKTFNVILRLKHYPLPFTLRLEDFIMEKHPGTEMARSYKSRVSINPAGVWREKLISMNNPLRYKNFTLYQSSYSIDRAGRETSTLAVVENQGRVLPYIATFVTFLGLVVHFIMMALMGRGRRRSAEKKNAS